MNQEFRKKKGRFIKKDSRLSKVVAVKEFSFYDICAVPITYPDNPQGNIIHQDLHLQEDLDEGVRSSSELEVELGQPGYTHVIQPLDFTEEWEKQKKRASAGRPRYDDEDEFEMEMEREFLKRKQKIVAKKENENPRSNENISTEMIEEFGPKRDKQIPITQAPIPTTQKEVAAENIQSAASSKEVLKSHKEPLESIEEAISQVSEQKSHSLNLPIKSIENQRDIDFLPMKAAEGEPVEHAVMDRYKDQVLGLTPKKEEELINEAKSRGYAEGFQIGEQKASFQFKEQADSFVGKLESIIKELGGLKKDILENAEENFYVLSKALLEALLKKEFKVNPESFSAVIRKAIDEAIPNDEFKIHINENTRSMIEEQIKGLAKSQVTIDNKIGDFDFKVSSNLTMVDGSIQKIVGDLLDNADLELFEKMDKAS